MLKDHGELRPTRDTTKQAPDVADARLEKSRKSPLREKRFAHGIELVFEPGVDGRAVPDLAYKDSVKRERQFESDQAHFLFFSRRDPFFRLFS